MWGFTSRKEQDGPGGSNDIDDKTMSPSKRSRRRIGRKKAPGATTTTTTTTTNDGKHAAPKKSMGPLSFSRNGGHRQQHQPPNEQALGPGHFGAGRSQNDASTQQQDVNVDATDEQGIEILLDMSSHAHPMNAYGHPQNNSVKRSPVKGGHHSRRSMSNHKSTRRSAPPDPKRQLEHSSFLGTSTTYSSGDHSRTVVSLENDVLTKRTKIFRAQFSIFFPIPTLSSDPLALRDQSNHRIPLGGRGRTDTMAYNDQIRMLQNANPVDEVTSVRLELKKMKMEIDALEEDKEALEQRWLTLNQQQKQEPYPNNRSNKQIMAPGMKDTVDWDIHRLLSSKRNLGPKERTEFEVRRGNCITVHLQNPRAEEAFLNKCCGAKQIPLKKAKRRVITMDPYNCRAGGAGATIRHLALLPKGSSFFVSRDNGKSYSWGQLPPRLLQRMKTQGLDPVRHCGELMYLSTGPNGYYFAEFSSGECWWGCAGEDKEFYEILQHWDIYRVVFGASVKHTAVHGNDENREVITNSWIIIGRDGRAAWKNLPSRLHQTLESRLANSAAPAEVALGCGDSYYVRFLDGTIDYCLPAELASVCERIQRSGGVITDMALNPEVSHEFMVRHTEIPPC
jgi:ribosomal protein S7